MQKLPVYLYTNLFDVILDLDNNRGIHQIMYQRPLEIQKGVKNTVQLQFKNSDQKKVSVYNKVFKLNVIDPVDKTLAISKTISILDNNSTTTNVLKGMAEVVFLENELSALETKTYNFSIVGVADDGTAAPAYTNTYYGVSGTLSLKDEVYPVLKPSTEVKSFQAMLNTSTSKWEKSTGNIRLYPESISNSGLHTVAFYLNAYRGTIFVEGTLENTPGYYGNYATLSTKTYTTAFSGVDYITFNGVFTNIRVRWIPASNPVTGLNNDVVYSGTIDKVLVRN